MKKEISKRKWFSVATRKQVLVPTCLGWIVLCVCVIVPTLLCGMQACAFLSPNQPIQANALIIEGWAPDYVLATGLEELHSGVYQVIVTTGGPLWRGEHLATYKTNAELSAASLVALGADPNQVVALPAPYAPRDRTRVSALEVQKWLLKHPEIKTFNLMTVGPHARRSHLEFKRALPSNVQIGIISIPDEEFDHEKWWHSSAGIKTVITEGLAYLYKRLN